MKRIILALTLLVSGLAHAAVDVTAKPASGTYTFNGSWTGANSTPAPTSYYHFDEGSGTALTDIGTDGSYDISSFTGTPDWTTCSGVACLNFDGSTEWIDVAGGWGTAQQSTNMTICAVHIADDFGAQDSTIVGVGNTSSGNDDYLMMGTNGTSDKYNVTYRLDGTASSDTATSASADTGVAKLHCLVWTQASKNASVYADNGSDIGISRNVTTIGAFTNNVGRIAATPEGGTPSEIFDGKIVALYVWKSTALNAAQMQDVCNWNGTQCEPWPFLTPSGTCPATCVDGPSGPRSARCITDISDASDADNILYGLSPAAVANEDTVCYDPSSVLGDTVSVSAAGWPSFASGGSQLTDSFDYCVMDNGAACGTDGKYEVTFQPTITSVTGIGTGQTTGTVTVTPAGPTEGTVRGVAISKTRYDTYGAPTHAQIAAGVDANDANVAWGSEFTKSFLSTVSPGWTFGRASSQTYEKSDGTLGTVTSGNPAFTYSGGTAQGVLLEGSRTNLLKYSAQVGDTNWTKRGTATATQNSAVAPDGTSTATLIAGIGSVGTNDLYQVVTGATASAALAAGVWIKKVSLTGVIYLTNPASSSYGAWNINLALLGNEWERITSTHPAVTIINPFIGSPSNQAGLQFAAAAGAPLSLYTGNTMIEIGAFPSSDIPTTTAPVPRVTTDLTRSWTFDTNNFSGYIEAYPGFASTETSATNPVFSAYKDANNYLTITHPTTSGRMDLNLAIGGTTATAQVTGLTWAKGDKLDIRFRKNASGIKLWVEAGSTETTTGVAPNAFTTPPDTVRLGRDESSNYGFWTVGSAQLWNSVDDTALGALN